MISTKDLSGLPNVECLKNFCKGLAALDIIMEMCIRDRLKTGGSGKLPPKIQKRKTKHLTASANDAFAAIRITAKDLSLIHI